ncbi:phosphoribosylpyrophosphate synthetase, partial [archaeon]|nr:phosphoribosylpyrophosphate synthetase [archaeon]
GAKKVILVAPYLAYMRQDKMFNYGESITSRVMANMLNISVDKIITIDPHLHRYKSLKEILTIPATKMTANSVIADYVKSKVRNPVIIGPDWESFQWAEVVAKQVGCPVTCLEKTRFSSRKVTSKMKNPIPIKGKDVVIVDDIISTGNTIIQAAKKAKKAGAKSITAIGVHGIFVENAIPRMKKNGVTRVLCTNTIERKESKLDVSDLIVKELKRR